MYNTDFCPHANFVEFIWPNMYDRLLKDFPKNDLFLNKFRVNNIYNNKKIIKFYIKKFDKKSKVIFYAPTWRPYKSALPLLSLKKFDLKKFDLFLRKNKFYFFYNFHIVRLLGKI